MRTGGRHPGIARILTLHHAGEIKACRQVHRHVLERVNGDVGAPFFQRDFQLLDEQALATNLGQAAVQDLVALGGHAQQFHPMPKALQQGFDMLGLPQRQSAFPRGNGDRQA
jgi:hypothetical protein